MASELLVMGKEVASAITSGVESWISKQTPERVALFVESGIEAYIARMEAENEA